MRKIVSVMILLFFCSSLFGQEMDSLKFPKGSISNLEKWKVAVISLKSAGDVVATDAAAITSRLESEMIRANAFKVIERERLNSVIAEQGLANSGLCESEDCGVKLGRLVAVNRIITGTVSKVGKVYSLSLKRLNVETGGIDKTFAEDYLGGLEDVLTIGCQNLAIKLSEDQYARLGMPIPKLQKVKMVESSFAAEMKTSVLTWVLGGITAVGVVAGVVIWALPPQEKEELIPLELEQ